MDKIESIVERNRLLPTVCILKGDYDLEDIAIGVPAVLGENGIEDILQQDSE